MVKFAAAKRAVKVVQGWQGQHHKWGRLRPRGCRSRPFEGKLLPIWGPATPACLWTEQATPLEGLAERREVMAPAAPAPRRRTG